MIELDSELGIGTTRGRPVWTDHGRSHRGLPVFPEGVLAEDKVGEVEGETCRLSDTDLQHGDKICFILALKKHLSAECLRVVNK